MKNAAFAEHIVLREGFQPPPLIVFHITMCESLFNFNEEYLAFNGKAPKQKLQGGIPEKYWTLSS